MLVLGINAAYHESAAALVRDGRVVMAVEEERLTREKHAKPALVSNPDQLPWTAIGACLEAAGARLADVDRIGYSFEPGQRLRMAEVDPYPLLDDRGWGTRQGELEFERRLRSIPTIIAERGDEPALAQKVCFVPHHVAHAACAFHCSPFETAAVLIVDGIGELTTAYLGRARAGMLEACETVPYPHSIGMFWEQLSRYLGFGEYDAGKAMALAAYGEPERFASGLSSLFRVGDPDGGCVGDELPFAIVPETARLRGDLSGFEEALGPRRTSEPLPDARRFADVAAAVQRRTEQALLALSRRLSRATGERALVYAGGVALNCVANARLEREGPFEAMYIPGPAHDAGTALGVALLLGRSKEARASLAPADAMSPCLGPRYATTEVDAAIHSAGLTSETVAHPQRRAAELIAEGKIVGWFEGAMELGPRALGSRSLLADPRQRSSRERLNAAIKARDAFQPFAAACLAEAAHEWFELSRGRVGAAASRELMLFAYPVLAHRVHAIPAVVHHDGSCRLQTVHADRQSSFHSLIQEFGSITGVPLVINTSFNRREPIVCTPADALASFARSGIDALFLEGRLVVA